MNHGSTMRQVWRESWVYNVASVTWIMGLQCGKCHTNTGPSWGKCHTGWQCDKSKMSHWLIMWQMLQEMWGQNMAEVSVMYSNVSNIFILQMAGFHPRGSLCAEQWLNGAYFLAAANKTASALTSCSHAVTRQQVPSHPAAMLCAQCSNGVLPFLDFHAIQLFLSLKYLPASISHLSMQCRWVLSLKYTLSTRMTAEEGTNLTEQYEWCHASKRKHCHF